MNTRDVIVIGASAGGVEALKDLVSALPAGLGATIFIVIHQSPRSDSYMAHILQRVSRLPVLEPADHSAIQPGSIYVAPADRHMLLEQGSLRVVHGPRENRHRPAIDPLFRSAALTFGPRVVGVILTGMLDDGVAGLIAIKRAGGIAVVQDPDDALFPEMPINALRYAAPDHCLPLRDIPALMARLSQEQETTAGGSVPAATAMETEAVTMDTGIEEITQEAGTPSVFTCPDCNGALWEMQDDDLLRYRCHVGHSYTMDALQMEMADNIEKALYNALRTIEEKVVALRRLAERFAGTLPKQQAEYERRAQEQERHAQAIRDLLAVLPGS